MRHVFDKIKNRAAILVLFILCGSILFLPAASKGGEGIKVPPVATFTLNNGLRFFVIADELPQTTIIASIGLGSLYEDSHNAGQSALLAKTLSIAGSQKYPGKSLYETIESIGGKLSIQSSWEHTLISIKVLSRFSDRAFDIIQDILINPDFNESDFNTARSLVVDEIKRKYDDPATIAFEQARSIIFNGKGYGSVATVEGVSSYNLGDIKSLWQKYVVSGNILMGINSSQGLKEIQEISRHNFSSLTEGPEVEYAVDISEVTGLLKKNADTIFLYPRDIPQATIVIGTAAPTLGYSGAYSLKVMNYILGGGSFNSRLMNEIRVKGGLAYAVQSIMRFRHRTGIFLAFAQTENKTAARVLNIMLDNISKISSARVTKQELEWAKDSISNSYIFNFDTLQNVLNNYLSIEYNDLPGDYYESYLDNISAVTPQSIKDESVKVFSQGLVKVVVGKKELADILSSTGKVVVLSESEVK